jgi:tetratricopeptide (TPR) repeat protein
MRVSRFKFLVGALLLVIALINWSCTPQIRKARYSKQAERHFKAGQYDEAKIEYLKLLRVDPRNAVAYARMGQMWLEEGSPLRAGTFLAGAIKFDPKDWASHIRLAKSYGLIGQPAEERQAAESILKQAPDNGEALLLLAEASRSPDDYSATEQETTRFPNKQSAYFQLVAGLLALRKSDLAAAETAVKLALAADPKSPPAHVGMAFLLLSKNDRTGAGDEFKKAADLSPTRSRERLNYADFKRQEGSGEEAKGYLKNLTAQARDFIAAWTAQARIAMAERKYDEAASLLENVFSRDPDDPDARIVRAQIYLAKKEPKKAIEIFDRLDKSFPNSPAVKFQLAVANLQAGNLAQAVVQLEHAVASNPNYADAVLLLAELNLRVGKAQAAVNSLSSLVQNRPDLVRAQILLADALQAVGRPDDAAAVIREQIKAAPQNPQPYLLLGLLLKQKKTGEARQAFEKIIELDKKNVQAIDELVSLDIIGKDFASARRRIADLLQQSPPSAVAYYLQGKIEFGEAKHDRAEASLKKAIELDPNLSPAFNLLVASYLSANKLPDALRELKVLHTKNPRDVTPMAISGLIHQQQNDFSKARDDYEEALAVNPNLIVPLNNLAYIYSEQLNDLARAAKLAGKAHELAPSQPSISDTLGWILYKQGDYQHALELLQETAPKLSDNSEFQFHLGMAQYMMGNRDAAQVALQKATAGPGEFPWKAEAKTRLALLSNDSGTASNLSPAELEKIAKEKSTDPIALVRLGDSYEKQGASDKAVDAYQRALQANPRLLEATLKLAEINVGPLKNSARALEYAKKARELAPADPHSTATVGRVAYQAGNFTWAYNLLQESARQLPDDPAIAHDFAWAAYSTGKVGEAREAMQRIANMAGAGKEQQDAQRFLAMTELDLDGKDPTSSESEVASVLIVDPNYVPALMARADIQLWRGDPKSADTIFNQVLQRYPDFAPAQKRLAAIYADDPANAEKGYGLATKARRTLPDDPVLAIALGKLSFQRKDYAKAVQLLQQADRKAPLNGKSPLDGRSLFYLGMGQMQLGHKAEGREILRRALTAGISDSMAQEARQKIAESQTGPENR